VQSERFGWKISWWLSYTTIAVTEYSHKLSIINHKIYSTKETDYNSSFCIYDDLLSSTSNTIKTANPNLIRKFILDREFDSQRLFESMDLRGDKFIIRVSHHDRICDKKEILNFNIPIKKLTIKGNLYTNFNLNLKVEKSRKNNFTK
jgi:hypothetical protein